MCTLTSRNISSAHIHHRCFELSVWTCSVPFKLFLGAVSIQRGPRASRFSHLSRRLNTGSVSSVLYVHTHHMNTAGSKAAWTQRLSKGITIKEAKGEEVVVGWSLQLISQQTPNYITLSSAGVDIEAWVWRGAASSAGGGSSAKCQWERGVIMPSGTAVGKGNWPWLIRESRGGGVLSKERWDTWRKRDVQLWWQRVKWKSLEAEGGGCSSAARSQGEDWKWEGIGFSIFLFYLENHIPVEETPTDSVVYFPHRYRSSSYVPFQVLHPSSIMSPCTELRPSGLYKCQSTVMPPTGLRAAVLKPWLWRFVQRNSNFLFNSCFQGLIGTFSLSLRCIIKVFPIKIAK